MSQNITIMGASYSAVPAVTLPKTGGGTASFIDVTDTTAAASDVASGKYFYTAAGVRTAGTSSGGGGVSNVVMGTFTTGATRNSKQTVTIPYTGSGYPIALMVFIAGGVYNNTTGGNTTWYNSLDRYDVGAFYMTKSRCTTAPTYGTSSSDNQGAVVYVYKNSASTATSYSRSSSMTAHAFADSTASAATGATCCRFKGDGTTLSVYIGNKTSSAYGFPPSTELQYIIVYSS